MKRYRRAFDPVLLKHKAEQIIMSEDEEGIWVKYEDMIHEVRHLFGDIGGVGDSVSDEDLENYFKNSGFCE